MILTSRLLSEIPWLDHGFGTRKANLTQDRMASLKQIHSAIVLEAEQPGTAGQGDALVTRKGGLPVSVRTADCYPILLVDTKHRAVAAVHAGWRGTSAGIVSAALKRMGADINHTYAAIGPGIGVCCYEVGDEVSRLFGNIGRGCIDLAAANRDQLLEAGLRPKHIDVIGACTFCDAENFYSYRREKDAAGRLISYIGIR